MVVIGTEAALMMGILVSSAEAAAGTEASASVRSTRKTWAIHKPAA